MVGSSATTTAAHTDPDPDPSAACVDAAAVADSLERLLKDPSLREQLG